MPTPPDTIVSEPGFRHTAAPESPLRHPSAEGTAATRGSLSLLRTQAARFLTTLAWIGRHGFSRFRSGSIIIILLMICGLSIGWLSLGGLMLYARQLSRVEPLVLAGRSIDLTHPGVFIPFSVLLALLGVLSAALLYLAERRIALVTRDFERVLADQIHSLIHDPWCRGWQDFLERPLRSALNRLMRVGARWTAFSYRELLRGVLYGGIGMLGLITMLLVDVTLTLVLLPLAAVYVVPLYFINRGVARCHRQYIAADRDALASYTTMLKQTLQEGPSGQCPDAPDRPEVFADLWAAQSLFYDRILFVRRTTLVNGIFFMTILALLFMYFGLATGKGAATWGHFFVYLVALRFGWSGFQQVSTLCTNVSRFMAEYELYRQFVRQCNRLREQRRAAQSRTELPETLRLALSGEPRWGGARSVHFRRGEIMFILIPERPDHAEMEAALTRLDRCLPASVTIVPDARIVAATALDPARSLAQQALGDSPALEARQKLESLLETMQLSEEAAALPEGLDTILREYPQASVSRGLELAVTLAGDILTPPRVMAVSTLAVHGVPPPVARQLLYRLCSSYLIIVHHVPSALLRRRWRWTTERAAGFLVTDQSRVAAILDAQTLHSRVAEVETYLALHRSGDRTTVEIDDEG